MKRARPFRLLLSLFLVGLLLSVSACGSSSGVTADQNKGDKDNGTKVTLVFQNIYPDASATNHKVMKKIVSDYMDAHPNVKIELDSLNIDQQKTKLKTQAASNQLPDIFVVNPSAQMKPYVDAGLLAPLNDMLEQNNLKQTFQPGILDYYTFGGNVYALPDGNNIGVMYYNKKIFDEVGVKPPKDFNELLDVVKKVKNAGYIPVVIAEKETWTGSFLFMNIVLRTNGGPGFLQDVLDGKKTFEDPAFIEAVDKFEQLVETGAFQDGATSYEYVEAESLFHSGQAAMYYMGTWATGGMETATIKDQVGVFPFPLVDGKGSLNHFMLAPGSAFAISANSKHLAEAKDFLNYFMLQWPKINFDMKAAVGLAQNVDGDFQKAGYSQISIDVLDLFKTVQGGDLAFDNTMEPDTAQVHLKAIQKLFIQKEPPEAIAKEHQDAFNRNYRK